MGGIKEFFVKYGLPVVGAYLAFSPATMPVVSSYAQHQPFGFGVLAAWAVGTFLLKK